MGIHAHFALANRREIEAEVDRLIAMLDSCDAPFEDLEPETDAGGEELSGEGEEAYPVIPLYGIDQSTGPLNETAAHREWLKVFPS